MIYLELQRLGSWNVRRDDVSGSIGQRELIEGLGLFELHAAVKNLHAFHRVRVVVDQHLVRPHDGGLPQLAGREPGGLDVRDRSVRELQIDECDVRDQRLYERATHYRDGRRFGVEPIKEHRKIVWGQIPDYADVLLMQSQIHADRGDIVDLAETSGLDDLFDLYDRG